MAKTYFTFPKILFGGLGDIGDATEPAQTGQGTTDPYPCSFADWQHLFGTDLNNDGNIDEDDYLIWWNNQNYTNDDWSRVNPGSTFPPSTPPNEP
jgi:hypothetical protein